MRRLFEGGAYSSYYCNWQLKSLLHLGKIVITFRTLLHVGQNVITFRFRTLLHLGPFITFRPSTFPHIHNYYCNILCYKQEVTKKKAYATLYKCLCMWQQLFRNHFVSKYMYSKLQWTGCRKETGRCSFPLLQPVTWQMRLDVSK